MNSLLERLKGGSLISDGNANEVAEAVLEDNRLLPLLAEGLQDADNVVRARTAHALEKVSRQKPEIISRLIPDLIKTAQADSVPMVRWHIPMIFTNIDLDGTAEKAVFSALFRLLDDKSTLVKNWAISAIVILSRKSEVWRVEALRRLQTEARNQSASVKVRIGKAIDILRYNRPIPQGWYKGQQ
jgi:HEAT repeat protein